MTYYMISGSRYDVTNSKDLDITENLPVGNYSVHYDNMREVYYLKRIEDFVLPKKIYGDVGTIRDRIISVFNEKTTSTGVMLIGEKGSGKTLLSKSISIELAKVNVPTIIVNESFDDSGFSEFIQKIEQDVVVIFDEFEKVYRNDKGSQQKILSLFDGVFNSKKLFVLTANYLRAIDENLISRPSRMHYVIEYGPMTTEEVTEFATDNLNDKSKVNEITSMSRIKPFNFDSLNELVKEMNRFDISAVEACKYLNVFKSSLNSSSADDEYEAKVFKDNVHHFTMNSVMINIIEMANRPRAHVNFSGEFSDVANDQLDANMIDAIDIDVSIENLVKADGNVLKFEKDGYTIVCTKKLFGKRSLLDFFAS